MMLKFYPAWGMLEEALESVFGDVIGYILWLLLAGIIIGGAIMLILAAYFPCELVSLLPIECSCY
ncbi:MAG: hypothetical protein ABH829_03920 [archaeon]